MVADKFQIVIINHETLDIDFSEIDKSKLLEGLNEDLKCINKNINKNLIIKILDFTTQLLNKILSIITDKNITYLIYQLNLKKYINI